MSSRSIGCDGSSFSKLRGAKSKLTGSADRSGRMLASERTIHYETYWSRADTARDYSSSHCLHPSGKPWTSPDKLEQYKQWQAWRDRIVRTQTEQPFYLCFQLQDPIKPENPWELQLQVAPKSDPSLRVALNDYWRMRPKQQQQVKKQMGEDSELGESKLP